VIHFVKFVELKHINCEFHFAHHIISGLKYCHQAFTDHKESRRDTRHETLVWRACDKRVQSTSESNLIKLQRVQNTLARVTLQQGKFDRITPILEDLHWLPIEKRITFKLATLSYNIKSTGEPVYLRELLSDCQPVRTLQSSSKHLLTVNVAETVLVLDILL